MGQLSTYKIEGQPRAPFREAKNIQLEAIFGTENSPDLSLEEVTFANNNSFLDRDLLYSYWQQNPLEGVDIGVEITDFVDNVNYAYNFDFFTDWRGIKFNAPNELSVTLRNLNSVRSFDDRAQAITFALLEDKNVLTLQDYSNIPYIIENRKTLLEKIQLLVQAWSVVKMIFDEIHKILNIASDITTLGVVQATLNLTLTFANLVLLVSQLINLLKEIQTAFFPPVLYHSGIKPKTFIEKGAEYLGYDSVDFGTGLDRINKFFWCPSKNDEQGIPNNVFNPVSGAMKPGDYGYNLFETCNYFTDFWNWRKAIVNNVLHLRPKDDPFWLQTGSALSPDVLVESTLVYSNGTSRPNYDEYFSVNILEYSTDDSDLHTLRDLADPNNAGTAEKIISGYTVEPLGVINQKRVLNGQGKYQTIPHALCVRKDVVDDLLDTFVNVGGLSNSIKDQLTDALGQVTDVISEQLPFLEPFINTVGGRSGCMVVENHFFSTPKDVYLEDINTGFEIAPRIPTNFADYISAKALIEDYHYYDSFVPGVRNPNNLDDTAAKIYFDDVEIHMNVKKFTDILNNPYFSVGNGLLGKYTEVKWDVEKDKAVVQYWKQNAWMQNVEQNKI